MKIIMKQQLIIYALNIALSLCLDYKTNKFKTHTFKLGFKFTSNFENMSLIETYITNDQAFNHMKCILKGSENSLAISYEVGEDLTKICKWYSKSNFEPTDISVSNHAIIFYRNPNLPNYNCILYFI